MLARQIFPKLEFFIYELICVKNDFYPETIKNDNGAVVMRKFVLRRGRKQQLYKFKKRTTQLNRRLSELYNYVLVFCISMKLKAFHVTHNETPKMANNVRFY